MVERCEGAETLTPWADAFPSLQTILCVCHSVRRFRCAHPPVIYFAKATRLCRRMCGLGDPHSIGWRVMNRRPVGLRKVDRVGGFVRARRPSLHRLARRTRVGEL